jgi:hypothetical protein
MDAEIKTRAEIVAGYKKIVSQALGIPPDNTVSIKVLQDRFTALHPPNEPSRRSETPSIQSIADQEAETKRIASKLLGLLGIPDDNSLSLEELQDELKFATLDFAFSPQLSSPDELTSQIERLIAELDACHQETKAFQKKTQTAFAAVSLFWLSSDVSNMDTKEKVDATRKKSCEVFDEYMWPGSHRLYLRGMCDEHAGT